MIGNYPKLYGSCYCDYIPFSQVYIQIAIMSVVYVYISPLSQMRH